jgi:DUF1365 family protein
MNDVATDWMDRPQLCIGRVFHQRSRPKPHRLSVGVFFLRIPLSRLGQLENRWLSRDRFNLLSLATRDLGPRDGSAWEPWARGLLEAHGVRRADGQIVLQTFPRMLGYVFNPISLWYCHDEAGRLVAVIAEVNNTFGERHNYVVAHGDQRPIEPGDTLVAAKVFHVSPFCEVRGHYRFRFEQHAGRAFARIDYHDGPRDADRLIVTTVHGLPRPLTSAGALRAFLAFPFMTLMIIARIHWHAMKLWLKRVPFFAKPEPPATETTR